MKLTEKQKKCKYCHEPFITFFGKDGELNQVSLNAYEKPVLITFINIKVSTHIVRINNCPMCGRPLNEEEK